MSHNPTCRFSMLSALLLLSVTTSAWSQGTAFTYQGRLENNGAPATGAYDLRFKLFTDPFGNNQLGGAILSNAVPIAGGLFTVTIDFGAGVFNGSNYWLEIDVKTNGAASYENLNPLQPLTPVPYALFAENSGGAGLAGGTYTNAVTLNNPSNSFTGSFIGNGSGLTNLIGNGSGLTNLNASTLGGLGRAGFWQIIGNTGTSPTNANFLGTIDNQPLELRANSQRALRLEPNTNGMPNVIAGAPNNFVDPGIVGATIAGGGALNQTVSGFLPGPCSNHVSAIFGSIGGGRLNLVAADHGTIAGGLDNAIEPLAYDGFIAGGFGNTLQTNAFRCGIGSGGANTVGQNGTFISYSYIGGGFANAVNEYASVIAGGANNSILPLADHSVIAGGANNVIMGSLGPAYSSISGGQYNLIQSNVSFSVISGGSNNVLAAGSAYANVSGGGNNLAAGNSASVSGGYLNTANAPYAAVGGGLGNQVVANASVISGGWSNFAGAVSSTVAGGNGNAVDSNADYSTVGGGSSNVAAAVHTTVAGGHANIAEGAGAAVGGGFNNVALGNSAAVPGGLGNFATGNYSIVAGGQGNQANGASSFAAGSFARVEHDNSFVWSDAFGFASTAPNQFAVSASGGVLLSADVQLANGYHNLSMSGGNSVGFLYGAYNPLGDGIHLGYNYYWDGAGNPHCPNPGGPTSRISVGYGAIALCIGGVNTAPLSTMLYVDASGVCTPSGTINVCSDRNAKQAFGPIRSSQILQKVAQLPISEWSYKTDTRTRHIGPMAQDFYAAFNIGTDERHISPLDEGGVALAAIQALYQKVESDNAALRQENTDLKTRLERLERLVDSAIPQSKTPLRPAELPAAPARASTSALASK